MQAPFGEYTYTYILYSRRAAAHAALAPCARVNDIKDYVQEHIQKTDVCAFRNEKRNTKVKQVCKYTASVTF